MSEIKYVRNRFTKMCKANGLNTPQTYTYHQLLLDKTMTDFHREMRRWGKATYVDFAVSATGMIMLWYNKENNNMFLAVFKRNRLMLWTTVVEEWLESAFERMK